MTIRMEAERLQRFAWIHVGVAVLGLSLLAAPALAAKYTKISWDLHTSYASTFDGPNLSGPILGGTAVFTPAAGTFSTPSSAYTYFPGTLIFHLWGAAGDLTITNTPDCGYSGAALVVFSNGAVEFHGEFPGCSLRSGGVTYAFPLSFGPRKTINFNPLVNSYTTSTDYGPGPGSTQHGRVTIKTHNCEGGPPCPTITTLLHHDFYLGNEVRVSATTEVPALSKPAQMVLGLVLIAGWGGALRWCS
jgi:hypothetical protein